MTDFLDRIVARVLPVQSREGVVRTRPRSRFEEGVAGGAELEDGVESVDGAGNGAADPQGAGKGGEGATVVGAREAEWGGGTARRPQPVEARGTDPVLHRSPRGQQGDRSGPVGSPGSPGAGGSDRDSGRLDETRGRQALFPAVRVAADAGNAVPLRREPPTPGASPRPASLGLPGDEPPTLPVKNRAAGPVDVLTPSPAIRLRPSADGGATSPGQRPSGPERRAEDGGSRAPRRDGLPLRPSAGADARFPHPPEPALPAIQLRIGRVEIRGERATPQAPRPPAAPPPRPRAPAVDLAEYLRRRDAGRRP